MLYPYLGYMVVDFGLVDSPDQAGQYAGYIASMFTLGQLLTGIFWGEMSDRIGRRKVICFGLFATMIISPLFGLAQNIWQAMAVRFVLGLLNGNSAAGKAYIGEAVTKETEDLGFSIVAICWSFGNMVAASLGGFLCRPAIQYPDFARGTILERYPYLLPNLASSLFAGIGFCITVFFLPEQPTAISTDGRANGGNGKTTIPKQGIWSYILKHRRCKLIFVIVFFIFFLDYGMFEIYPLWAITTIDEGGLGWNPAQIGVTQVIGGFFLLVGNLVLLPWLRKKFTSSLPLQRFAILAMAIPGFSLFPVVSACCAGNNTTANIVLLPILFLRITSVGLIFTLTFQFINGMIDDRSILGGITGAAQQVGNVARFTTPTLSAWLVASGNSSKLPFPLDGRVPFVVFGICWIFPLFANLSLSASDINKNNPTKEEQVRDESKLALPVADSPGQRRGQAGMQLSEAI
jgi:MFS family permease